MEPKPHDHDNDKVDVAAYDPAANQTHITQLGDMSDFTEIDKAQDTKVRRKVDWRILPVISITYALQGIDKTTLGYAAVYGLREDLGLHGTQYSWASAIFYLGYLTWEFPANLLLQRLQINHYMSSTVSPTSIASLNCDSQSLTQYSQKWLIR